MIVLDADDALDFFLYFLFRIAYSFVFYYMLLLPHTKLLQRRTMERLKV